MESRTLRSYKKFKKYLVIGYNGKINYCGLPFERVNVICKRIQKFYLLLMCLGIISLVSRIPDIKDSILRRDWLESAITLIVFICIYIGLRTRAKWIVPLILLFSAYGLFSAYINGIQPAENVTDLVHKCVEVLYIIFYTYQFIFFTKKEVKLFFNVRGTIII